MFHEISPCNYLSFQSMLQREAMYIINLKTGFDELGDAEQSLRQ